MTTLTLILARIQPLEVPISSSGEACCSWGGGGGGGIQAGGEECRLKRGLLLVYANNLHRLSASKLYHNEAFFHSFFQP